MEKQNMSDMIKYIGCNDVDLRLFESQYAVPDGMCYNSYVILDEKVAIMDTSDKRTLERWKSNLKAALDGRKPDYLIVHHLEPDHSSGIAEIVAMYPDLQLVCSAKASTMIPLYFPDIKLNILAVKDGDSLSLGTHELQFVMAPMVHWPEVMVTYDSTARTLFSADAFGTFGVREANADDWACEARRYYFNICGKYGIPVSTLLNKVSALDVERILPLHGPVLSGEKLAEALRLYRIWSSYDIESEGVFIAYASIHGCTGQAVEKLAGILRARGCKKVVLTDLCRSDLSEAVEDAFRYGKIVLAASSYDGGLFSPMYDFLHRLQTKAWQKREVSIIENGSWAPSAGRVMRQMLEEMKDITIKGDTVTLRGILKDEDTQALENLAGAIME